MFKLLLKMAWKNSFLRLSRTLLVIVMIVVSMGMMVTIQGLYDGMAENMIDKNRRSQSGDISIFAKEYRLERELEYRIHDAQNIKKEIQALEGVRAVVSRVSVDGLAATARKSSFATLCAVNLQEEESFGHFSEFLKEGELELKKRGALVGLELAKTMKLRIGSKLIFSTQDSKGEINSIALRVKGIVQTTNIKLDTTTIFIDKKYIAKFLNVKKGEATQIALMGASKELEKRLKERYSSLDVKSFLELQPIMKMMQDMTVIFNSVTFFIVMMVVFIGILGVMYVSVLDRVREFGIMLCVGMKFSYIRTQIILESLIVGFIGYVFGSLLGLLFLLYLNHYGLDVSAYADAMESFGYDTVLYSVIKVDYFVNTFLAIMSASVLSTYLPLRKIKKLNPLEVISSES